MTYDVVYDIAYDVVRTIGKNSPKTYDIVGFWDIVCNIVGQDIQCRILYRRSSAYDIVGVI